MALEQRINLNLKLTQSLRMTPQLRQAIKILQVGRADLEAMVDEELTQNPVLEEKTADAPEVDATSVERENSDFGEESPSGADEQGEVAEAAASEAEEPVVEAVDWDEYVERHSNDIHGAIGTGSQRDDDARAALFDNATSPPEDIRHALLDQIQLLMMSEEERNIASIIILNLDEDGYLDCSPGEIAFMANCSEEQVNEVREIIQELEPPGAASRDLRDCLLSQLRIIGYEPDDYVVIIADRYLKDLESKRYDKIAKELDMPVKEVLDAHDIIGDLEPKPGRNYGEREARYVSPDAYIYRVGNEFQVTLNDEGLPALQISPYYRKLLESEPKAGEAKAYLQDKVRSAVWMIRSIEQRQRTLRKVTESIVKFQTEFLLHGVKALKPMVLKDVANDIGMHESTVSRTTANKYVHTPQGLFELKYFFTSSLRSATGEGDVSSETVKQKIQQIIESEDSAKPFSDQYIATQLKRDSIDIARRTVAKYRENLGILPSSKRKSYVPRN